MIALYYYNKNLSIYFLLNINSGIQCCADTLAISFYKYKSFLVLITS
jgi:hypothetical protein